MCRLDAERIAAVHQKLESEGHSLQLVGIVKENLGDELKAFAPSFPGGQLYVDKAKSLFKLLKHPRPKLSFKDLFSIAGLKRIWKAKTGGNVTGEGWWKGGYVVLGSKEQGPLYLWHEEMNGSGDFEKLEVAARQATAKANKAQ